jgi:hypothetical protein
MNYWCIPLIISITTLAIGFLLNMYFWGAFIDFSITNQIYGNEYDMNTGCHYENCSAFPKLLCHKPFYAHCWRAGLAAIVFTIMISGGLFVIIIFICNRVQNNDSLIMKNPVYEQSPELPTVNEPKTSIVNVDELIELDDK